VVVVLWVKPVQSDRVTTTSSSMVKTLSVTVLPSLRPEMVVVTKVVELVSHEVAIVYWGVAGTAPQYSFAVFTTLDSSGNSVARSCPFACMQAEQLWT
jgi:hypothetical protein